MAGMDESTLVRTTVTLERRHVRQLAELALSRRFSELGRWDTSRVLREVLDRALPTPPARAGRKKRNR